MCGIAGVAARIPGLSVRSAAERLRHRGPDTHGSWRSAGEQWSCELVHTRLSIVDLSPAGEQPMVTQNGRLAMVFNGEIYNAPDLRRRCEANGHRFRSSMDGEVILHLWEDEGAAALGRLNGIFAVAVVDTATGEVVLARDPLGVKPLFYSGGSDGLWFASEIAALASVGAPIGSPDLVALAQFLAFLWVPDPRTPFSGVRSVEPGHAVRWSPFDMEAYRYGEPLVPVEAGGSMEPREAVDALAERFEAAAQRQLMADVPIGLMASGGVDSGLLWAATRQDLAKAFTITWDEQGGGERLDEDVAAVSELQRRFGTDTVYLPGESAEEVSVPTGGDLFADPAYELTRLIARSARDLGFKVLLSGQGGDELFAGYRRHSLAPALARLRPGLVGRALERLVLALPRGGVRAEYLARALRAAAAPDPFEGYMQLCSYSTAEERARVLGCTEAEVADEVVWQRHRAVFDRLPSGSSLLRRVMAVDLLVYLPGLGLSYVDRAGMEFGVEIRVPWLDLELVRWSLTLPDRLLMRGGRGKWLPRELAAKQLSPSIAHRAKRAFAAPSGRVGMRQPGGERGFRQGAYFSRAASMVQAFLAGRADGAAAASPWVARR